MYLCILGSCTCTLVCHIGSLTNSLKRSVTYWNMGPHLNVCCIFGTEQLQMSARAIASLDAIDRESLRPLFEAFILRYESIVLGNSGPIREGWMQAFSSSLASFRLVVYAVCNVAAPRSCNHW